MKNIHIGLSIYKSVLMILILLVFIYFGFQFILKPENYISIICPSRNFVQISGYSVVLIFFVFLALFLIKLIYSANFGVNINEKGVSINIYFFDAKTAFIEWSNVKNIERLEYYGQSSIIIYLKNNDIFFDKIKNKISLFIYKNRCNKFGSPIVVTSKALKIKDNDELQCLLQDSFNEFKKKNKLITNNGLQV